MALNSRLLIYVIELAFLLIVCCSADDNCETVPSEIHVTKGNQSKPPSYLCIYCRPHTLNRWLFK